MITRGVVGLKLAHESQAGEALDKLRTVLWAGRKKFGPEERIVRQRWNRGDQVRCESVWFLRALQEN